MFVVLNVCNLLVVNLFYKRIFFSYTLKQTVESTSFQLAALPTSSEPQEANKITRIILPTDGKTLHSLLKRLGEHSLFF